MKRIVKIAAISALFALCASSAFAANAVRISQVYGGGGNSGAQYNEDFIELFNSSSVAVDVSGWAVEYASSGSTSQWGTTFSGGANYVVLPAGTLIQPCSYFLVGAAFGAGTTLPALPTPDALIGTAMSATAGKVAVFTQLNAAVSCGSEVGLVDKVSFGTVNCAEGGSGTPTLSNTLAAIRNNGGLTDTDVNSADFSTGAPTPRNSASGTNPACNVVPTIKNSWGQLKSLYR